MNLRDRAIQAAYERDQIREADKQRRAMALRARASLLIRSVLEIDVRAEEWEVVFTTEVDPRPYARTTIEGIDITVWESGNPRTLVLSKDVELKTLADFGDVLLRRGGNLIRDLDI